MLTIFKLIMKFMELFTKLNEGTAAIEEILDSLSWIVADEEESTDEE